MWYIIIIAIVVIIINWIIKNTFLWETIIKSLWKQVYQLADIMAVELKHGNETLYIEKYKKLMSLRGNIINSVLDFVNYLNKEKDEDAEEETFGYGRYDFELIYNTAKNSPDSFKKLIK